MCMRDPSMTVHLITSYDEGRQSFVPQGPQGKVITVFPKAIVSINKV